MPESPCAHHYTLGGIVYVDDTWPLPGTGACRRTYYRYFYCQQCLAKRHERLPVQANTYEPIRFEATPERPEALCQEDGHD